jgi:PKD repeat protein
VHVDHLGDQAVTCARTAILLALCACGGGGRPTADPGPLQRSARAGESLEFDGSASRGSITRYQWDFGDGTPVVTDAKATHAYATNGDYTATLTVRGPGGAHSAAVLVNVGAGCTATAMISVPTADPQPNAPVVFASTGSTGCRNAMLKTWEWDFGDGTPKVTGDSSKATVSHTFTSMGTYNVKLRVVDVDDNEGTATRSLGVGVMNLGQPTISSCAANMTQAVVNRPVQFSVAASDPGGMAMTYAWTFSDGTTAMGQSVSKTFMAMGMYSATVVATTADQRMSNSCTTAMVTVGSPPSYTGNWILNPTGGSFSGTCPFSVNFPTAAVSVFHTTNPDGGPDLVVVTPSGGSYPPGNPLSGTEETAGSFLVTRNTPTETPGGTCSSGMQTAHRLRLTFTSATQVTGSWTKTYNGCDGVSCPLSCNCVAGGSMAGAFSGFKQ